MPDQEPPHSATSAARKEEVDPLFSQWAADEERAQRVASDVDDRLRGLRRLRRGVAIRLAATVVLALIAAIVLWKTRSSVAYWFEPSTPTDLGDLRQRWLGGDALFPGEPNTHVAVSGLVPSRLIGVSSDPDRVDPDQLEFVFFCPLYNVTVLTRQRVEIPSADSQEIDPGLAKLVLDGLADPADTMVAWRGSGRLLRGNQAPPELRAFVDSYARRLGKQAGETWVLIEGKTPGDVAPSLVLWALALIPLTISLIFYLRARRTWNRALDTGRPP